MNSTVLIELPKLTKEPLDHLQLLEREAFIAGAEYMFRRLGIWYGNGHLFYQRYFEECAARREAPRLVSMINEEVYGISNDYARGWRQKMYEKF